VLDPNLSAALIDAAHSARFATLVLQSAHSLAGVDEVFAYRAEGGCRPEQLLSSSVLADAPTRASLYSERFYRHDPAARAREPAASQGFFERVTSEQIGPREYRAICFERPRFAEKLCYGWRDREDSLVLSFYRRRDRGASTGDGLSALATVVLGLLARRQPASTLPLRLRLERQIALRHPQLTLRERQVCALTLAGSTSEEAASELGIRQATVLTYRQRAYRRLGFGDIRDFLETLVD
jgi:DNA-binding CsgD family transcriptional regulator